MGYTLGRMLGLVPAPGEPRALWGEGRRGQGEYEGFLEEMCLRANLESRRSEWKSGTKNS